MNIKLCLIEIDHLFTERISHWIEQQRYGKSIDFSIPENDYGKNEGGGVRALPGICFSGL